MATKTNDSKMEKIKAFWKKVWEVFGIVMRSLLLFSPGIIFLVIYYFMIVWFAIGQDMLIQTGEYSGPTIATVISMLIWMILAWLSLRLVSNIYVNKHPGIHRLEKKFLYHAPRFLAYNVPVGLQIAAINLPSLSLHGMMQKSLFAALLLFHTIYYFLLHRAFQYRFPRNYRIAAWILGLLYIMVIGLTFFTNVDSQFWMMLSAFYFICQIVFLKIAVRKRTRSNTKTNAVQVLQQPKIWNWALGLIFGLALLLYCLITHYAGFANEFGALGCLLLAMGLWVTGICFVKMWAIKSNMRFTLIILVFAIVFGCNFDQYQVNLQEEETVADSVKNYSSMRLEADRYINKWFEQRKDAIEESNTKGQPYPIYLVLSDGGASKSGFWVASILSKLEKDSPDNDKFSSHLLSLSGASGGSVGNVAFYCDLVDPYRSADYTTPKWQSPYPAAAFLEADFMTYTLSHFLGPDLLGHLIPTRLFEDRGTALEEAMEHSDYNPQIGKQFNKPIEKIIDTSGSKPMLFINVTNVDLGSPGLISSVKFGKFSHRMDVLEQVDEDRYKDAKIIKVNGYDSVIGVKKPRRIKLSTAVALGARFPYVSPAGEINHNYFVDGGYYDNSGAGITLELMRYLDKRINSKGDPLEWLKGKGKICFKALYLSNGLAVKDDKRIHPLLNDLAAPLMTVLGTYTNQTNLGTQKLDDFLQEIDGGHRTFDKVNLPKQITTDTVPYPMNWVLSDYNINRMQHNLAAYPNEDILNIKKGDWGVLYGTSRNLKDAELDVNESAKKFKIPNAKIYYLNGFYCSVAVADTKTEANDVLLKARNRRKGARIVDMLKFCPNARANDGFLDCALVVEGVSISSKISNAQLIKETRESISGESTWGVVYGGDKTLEDAQYEVTRVPKLYNIPNARIYYHRGSYRSVSVVKTHAEAKAVLIRAKKRNEKAYIIKMKTWCPNALETKEGCLDCSGSKLLKDEPAAAKN